MDKQEILVLKLQKLLLEIDLALNKVNKLDQEFLISYKEIVEGYIFKAKNKSLTASKGGLLGTMRAISEFDSLSKIDSLYNAAYEVDLFYSKDCVSW